MATAEAGAGFSDFDSFDDSFDDEVLVGPVETPGPARVSQPGVGGYEEIPAAVPLAPVHPVDHAALATYIYPTNLELRDYQFTIVREALYQNLLCALPTGLGKTFIASAVMLNYYRWFPQGKIIFMAPTRPLVAQQIKAFCGITGIPPADAAVLLDKTKRRRAEIWQEKRVFFTTPQVVENDLAHGLLDPRTICLLVVDEAHRSRGNYAYHNVARFIGRFSRAYRLLALTATPAADVEGVQEVVDNLGISKIEVRTEESPDIKKYMQEKTVERISVGTTEELEELVALVADAAAPVLALANGAGVYEITDPTRINAFMAMDAIRRLAADRSLGPAKFAQLPVLRVLFVIGHALGRLRTYGVRPFFAYLSEKFAEFLAKLQGAKRQTTEGMFYTHEAVAMALARCEALTRDETFLGHPKLAHTIDELLAFFEPPERADSRVIIFTEFRESAVDIVRAIELVQNAALRSHIFIGQAPEKDKFDEAKFAALRQKSSKKRTHFCPEVVEKPKRARRTATDTSGFTRLESSLDANQKGMTQKNQKELIRKFRAGDYNILVATSIGEEGLDIGEVDMIVCYDSTRSPIKNVQRMGRTGRKRNGRVVLLFSGNEERKFNAAMAGYEYIQNHIVSGPVIQLHQSDRMIPPGHNPVCHEMRVELPPEGREIANATEDEDEILKIAMAYMMPAKPKSAKKAKSAKKPKSPTRSIKQFFMPMGVPTGFASASTLVRKTNAPKAVPDADTSYVSLEDFRENKRPAEPFVFPLNILDGLSSDDEALAEVKRFETHPATPLRENAVTPEKSPGSPSDDFRERGGDNFRESGDNFRERGDDFRERGDDFRERGDNLRERGDNLRERAADALNKGSPDISRGIPPPNPCEPIVAPSQSSSLSTSQPLLAAALAAVAHPAKPVAVVNVVESLRLASQLRRPPVIQVPHNTSIDNPMLVEDEESAPSQPAERRSPLRLLHSDFGSDFGSDSDANPIAEIRSRLCPNGQTARPLDPPDPATQALAALDGASPQELGKRLESSPFDDFSDSSEGWDLPLAAIGNTRPHPRTSEPASNPARTPNGPDPAPPQVPVAARRASPVAQDLPFDFQNLPLRLALSKEQSTDLFANYYYDLEADEIIDYLTPNISARKNVAVGRVPHLTFSTRYIEWLNRTAPPSSWQGATAATAERETDVIDDTHP